MEELPLGYGVENATYTSFACVDKNCDFCRFNYLICETCQDNEPPFVLHNGTCFHAYDLPNGIGQDIADYTGKECLVTDCLNCTLDYNACISCNKTLKNLGLMDGACVYCDPKQNMATVGEECIKICENPSCLLLLVGSRYNYHKATATIKFSKEITIKSLSKLKLMLNDPWTNNNFSMTSENMDMTLQSDSLVIVLRIAQSRYMGQLVLEPTIRDDTPLKSVEVVDNIQKPYLNFPVLVESIFG